MDQDLQNMLLLIRQYSPGERTMRLSEYGAEPSELDTLVNEGLLKRYKGTFQITSKGAQMTPLKFFPTDRYRSFQKVMRERMERSRSDRQKYAKKRSASVAISAAQQFSENLPEDIRIERQEAEAERKRREMRSGRVAPPRARVETEKSTGGTEGFVEEVDRILQAEMEARPQMESLIESLRKKASGKKVLSMDEQQSIAQDIDRLTAGINAYREEILFIEKQEQEVSAKDLPADYKAKKRNIKSLLNNLKKSRDELEARLASSQESLLKVYKNRVNRASNSMNRTPEFRKTLQEAERLLMKIQQGTRLRGEASASPEVRRSFTDLDKVTDKLEKLAAQSFASEYLREVTRGEKDISKILSKLELEAPGMRLMTLKKMAKGIKNNKTIQTMALKKIEKAQKIYFQGKSVTREIAEIERIIDDANRDEKFFIEAIFRDFEAVKKEPESEKYEGELASILATVQSLERRKDRGEDVLPRLKSVSRRLVELRKNLRLGKRPDRPEKEVDPMGIARSIESEVAKLRTKRIPPENKLKEKNRLKMRISMIEATFENDMRITASINLRKKYARALKDIERASKMLNVIR